MHFLLPSSSRTSKTSCVCRRRMNKQRALEQGHRGWGSNQVKGEEKGSVEMRGICVTWGCASSSFQNQIQHKQKGDSSQIRCRAFTPRFSDGAYAASQSSHYQSSHNAALYATLILRTGVSISIHNVTNGLLQKWRNKAGKGNLRLPKSLLTSYATSLFQKFLSFGKELKM